MDLKDRGGPVPGVFQVCEHEGGCEVTSRLLKAIAMKTFPFKDNKKEAEKPRL